MKPLQTSCCIVGAGPGGMMLAYLLARKGVDVTLLEAQQDFDREFRGDTLHPSVMENLEQLGLTKKLLKLKHTKAREAWLRVQGKALQVFDFDVLKGKTDYPYITLMDQARFLEFMAAEAKHFEGFHLMMETKAIDLIRQRDRVVGVKVKSPEGEREIRADLVVAADGRFSTIRERAEMDVKKTAVPMDVIWFKLPKASADEEVSGVMGHVMPGNLAAQLDRGSYWQIGGIVPKGSIKTFRKQGIESFQDHLIKLLPMFEDRLRKLEDWKDVGFFRVECGRVKRWYQSGLLLIGDAAHVMSPVGGVGINYAIQDAVVAANILAKPLREGVVSRRHLAKIQRRRIWPTRVVQWFQGIAHRYFVKQALKPNQSLKAPLPARWQWVRNLVARFLSFGLWRVKVKK